MPSYRPGSAADDGVTVVVPTRDRPAQLAACLQSIGAALRDLDELIVVDSASVDAEAVARVARDCGARLVRCERPGSGIARNAGWQAGGHSIVLFTDDDVVVDPGWRDALAAAVDVDHTVGFVTGRVLAPEGTTPSRDVAIKRDAEPATFDATSVGNLGHGASVGLRRDILERLGGWDESLGVGGRFRAAPEHDLFDRCFALGLSGRYEPAALAWHEQWRGPRRLLLLDARYGFGSGARLAKLVRTNRARARVVAADHLRWGRQELLTELRARHGYPALGSAIRLLAIPIGFLRAIAVPLDAGHFRSRR